MSDAKLPKAFDDVTIVARVLSIDEDSDVIEGAPTRWRTRIASQLLFKNHEENAIAKPWREGFMIGEIAVKLSSAGVDSVRVNYASAFNNNDIEGFEYVASLKDANADPSLALPRSNIAHVHKYDHLNKQQLIQALINRDRREFDLRLDLRETRERVLAMQKMYHEHAKAFEKAVRDEIEVNMPSRSDQGSL